LCLRGCFIIINPSFPPEENEKKVRKEIEMNTRRVSVLFIFTFLFLLALSSLALAEIHTTQNMTWTYYHVDGKTSRSFYPSNAFRYLYEGNVNFKSLLKDYELFGNIDYRSTDDRTVDTQDFSVERMYMGLRKEGTEALIGDFYQNFSEYSLGNALKGLKLSLGDETSSRLILVGGMDTPKWEDLWEKRQSDSSTRRYVWGSRLENTLLRGDLSLNFNYAGANDDYAYTSSSAAPMLVNVFSTDGKYKINDHLLSYWELAQSFTDEDTRKDEAKVKNDGAYKAGIDLNLRDYSLSSVYSRVGNHFNTTGGFNTQDLETMNFDGIWYLPLKIKFNHFLHMDRDNLSKTKTTTTNQLNPGGKFTFRIPWEIDLQLGGDLRKRFSTDKTVNQYTQRYTTSISRDFRIFYSTLGYTKSYVRNRVTLAQERDVDTYSLSLDGSFYLKAVKYAWSLMQDVSYDYYLQARKADIVLAPSVGLKVLLPSTLCLEGKIGFSDNNYYTNDTDSNNSNYFFAISRDIKKDLSFQISYDRRSHRYTDGDNNYGENLLKGQLSYKF